jgi:asparagine synthase (glutamine-hydrolysing)
MCGICGVIDFNMVPDVELLTAMMGRLAHRGPDGSGYFRDEHAGLGHTRLAIIDQVGGAQPMGTSDGSTWITFNGEIFNYLELADELRGLGHTFRTASDTEVILHAWQQWGEDCFERFNGQWALALWDRPRRLAVLSRDRLGVRPLFYHHRGGRLVFGSEVKALFADPTVPRRWDPEGLDEILTLWSTIGARTVFADVHQLEPGSVAVFGAEGLRTRRYYTIDFPAEHEYPRTDLRLNAAELRDRVVEATRLRFVRSDVPVGAYLSGGVDSAVTAAAIRRFTDSPLHTFSLRFSDAEYDEGFFQNQMVQTLGAEHHEIVVEQGDIAAVFPSVVAHTETPVLRSAPAPLFLLSRLVRDHGFKVVVTGEGADEVLAGYDIFREAKVRQFFARDPDSERRGRAAELLYPWMVRSPGRAPAFSRSFFTRHLDPADPGMSHRTRWDTTSVLKNLLAPGMAAAIGTGGAVDRLLAGMPEQAVRWPLLSRAQWLEMTTLLPGYILSSQGDRMLMGHSVEGRFPFLDPDVVDYANHLPSYQKMLGVEEKYLLKRAFADLVPEPILRRPKQPYRAPDAASFFVPSPAWLDDVLSPRAIESGGVFDTAKVGRLVAKCEGAARARRALGNTDNMRMLAVLSTQLLHQQFIAGDGATGGTRPAGPILQHDLLRHG